jgi:hypothetical protein
MMKKRQNRIVQCLYIIGITIAAFFYADPAYGQFIVQPLIIQIPAAPGELVRTEIQLQNHDTEEIVPVSMSVVDISQAEDGSWIMVGPDTNDVDSSKLLSCKRWVNLSAESVRVQPGTITHVRTSIKVQPGTRGVYSAGILVRMESSQVQSEIGFIFQFLIPVLISIQGRTPIRSVEVTDLGLELQPGSEDGQSRTLMSIRVANNGGTYSRLRALLKVWGYFEDHWRIFAQREVETAGILPGSVLKLSSDVGRPLPPGRYRIAGALLVDGRRSSSVEKEVDFAGDPSIKKIAVDAALDVKPKEIIINAMPGATRTTAVEISNATDEEVHVQVKMALPPVLRGVAFGPTYRGDDLNCSAWLEVAPTEFTLPKYGRQNIQIIARVPNADMIHPCYYALLGLFAKYPDGQNAGLETGHICVVNQKADSAEIQPQVRSSAPLTIAQQAGTEYIVSAVFGNYGKIHVTPKRCKAEITNPNGLAINSGVFLTGEKSGLMLPFEFRAYSGVLDFSECTPGLYRVVVRLGYDDKGVENSQVGIEVIGEGQQRVIQTIQQGEYERRVGIKWR